MSDNTAAVIIILALTLGPLVAMVILEIWGDK